jgi:hypothetical protein
VATDAWKLNIWVNGLIIRIIDPCSRDPKEFSSTTGVRLGMGELEREQERKCPGRLADVQNNTSTSPSISWQSNASSFALITKWTQARNYYLTSSDDSLTLQRFRHLGSAL